MSTDRAGAESVRTTVVLEFPGSGTSGRVRAMRLENLGFSPRYLLDEFRPRGTAIEEYAGQLFDRLADEDVGTIVSYCGATAIARHLAARYRRPPLLVALNPEHTVARGVADRLRGALAKIALPAETAARYDADADTVRDVIRRRLPDLEAAMAESYAGPPHNFGTVAGRLAGMQADWFAHLTAACDPDKLPAGPEELHMVARDHPCEPDCSAKHLTIDVDRTEFFTASLTSEALAGVLRS
ncbi:hypothetical protein [Streptomyces olivaceoviridis]|uniref:hypothetical protein n=1 Tax=Streptomyces olivaceoviridis TaxID=1921 RepID=UPI0036F67C32